GTKVGLLAGLMVVSAVRPLFERWLPEPKSPTDDLRAFAARLTTGAGRVPQAAGIVLAAVVVVAYGAGIVAAGGPARGPAAGTSSAELLSRLPSQVDPATLPPITIGQDVADYNSVIARPESVQAILVTLAQNLELENQALLHRDGSILTEVDHGDRLKQMQAALAEMTASNRTVVAHYHFDAVSIRVLVAFGVQTGSSLGFDSTGTVVTETYDWSGARIGTSTAPFHLTFALRQALGDRWLTVAVLPS